MRVQDVEDHFSLPALAVGSAFIGMAYGFQTGAGVLFVVFALGAHLETKLNQVIAAITSLEVTLLEYEQRLR